MLGINTYSIEFKGIYEVSVVIRRRKWEYPCEMRKCRLTCITGTNLSLSLVEMETPVFERKPFRASWRWDNQNEHLCICYYARLNPTSRYSRPFSSLHNVLLNRSFLVNCGKMTDVSTEASTEEEDVSPPWGTLPTEAYLLVNFTFRWAGAC